MHIVEGEKHTDEENLPIGIDYFFCLSLIYLTNEEGQIDHYQSVVDIVLIIISDQSLLILANRK